MKILKTLLTLVLLTSNTLFAHCPASYKPEKVCFWLDKNMVFIYDHKLEHNGPYKDLKDAEVTGIKSSKGDDLQFKKLARGIFKVEAQETQETLSVVITHDKKINTLKVTAD